MNIKDDAERTKKYDQDLAEKKATFDDAAALAASDAKEKEAEEGADEAKPAVFNEEEFKTEFDAANAVIEITAEPVEEIDNDYDLAYKAPVKDYD